MFRFIKIVFVALMPFFNCNALKFVSMNNQEYKVRPEVININTSEPSSYPCSVRISRVSGSCNNINDPYATFCFPDVVKSMNNKAFNLIPRTNETKYIKGYEDCKCKCRLYASFCNNQQKWNENKCRCEYEELIDKGIYDKGFIWNPNNLECESDKSCDVGKYLIIKNVGVERITSK